jgi:formylmethanofuran dehydrogenase subunit E
MSRELLDKAVGIHGHLGPFLVFGLRMGLAAEKILGGKPQRCEFESINKVPYLCAADGIRAIVGDNALTIREGDGITATFRGAGGRQTSLRVRENMIAKYVNVPWEKCEESAYEVLKESEDELFEVFNK